MTKNAHVSLTNDVPASPRAGGCHSSLAGARRIAQADNEQALRWQHITRLLGACGGATDKPAGHVSSRLPSPGGLSSDDRYGLNATIEILDRPSPVSAVLSWRDPTGCTYGYQIWQKGSAKRMGTCALSGTLIKRGDAIFRPRTASGMALNASAMILAVYIDCPQLVP